MWSTKKTPAWKLDRVRDLNGHPRTKKNLVSFYKISFLGIFRYNFNISFNGYFFTLVDKIINL